MTGMFISNSRNVPLRPLFGVGVSTGLDSDRTVGTGILPPKVLGGDGAFGRGGDLLDFHLGHLPEPRPLFGHTRNGRRASSRRRVLGLLRRRPRNKRRENPFSE